ncbi:protein FAM210B, mitochondrial [Heptranchias perlo]|uniref:protein FAM210B, mitochondrial n=1 Tax=Heptranchias perlo TaxID=212740 RepID=UPI003559AE04
MLSPFLLQSRQSHALLLLHKCFGKGARACGIGAAVRKGSYTARGNHSSLRARCKGPGCAAGERWPDARVGALGGLRTSASGDGTIGKEARKSGDGDKKPSKSQQLKQVFKEYGAVGVTFHTVISLTSFGMFYLAVSSGVDVVAVLYKLGSSEAVVQSRMAAGTSTFVLAYAVHKVFAPVRISITLVSVPLIVRYFRKIGLFKTSPSKP